MPQSASPPFQTFEIRPGLRQVLRDGTPAWSGVVVEENNLTVQISALRRALGPGTISTVPGRGCQWVGGALLGPTRAALAASPARIDASPAPVAVRGKTASAGPGGDLIGREAEFAWLVQALARQPAPGPISLVGPAGIGKTALARALAASIAASSLVSQPQAMPATQVCEVELAALAPQPPGSAAEFDTAAVAGAVASALGATAAAATPLERVLHHLSHGAAMLTLPSLLVLDNCEHVQAAAQALCSAMLAAAPGLRLLVTSQAPLKLPQEQLLRLESLNLPAAGDLASAAASGAVALFSTRAAAADRRFRMTESNVSAVVDICRRLEGIPLALELAAGRIALLGIEGLRTRLDERLRLLRGPAGAAPPRHQTLLAALDWSHGLLPPVEQTLLRRLSVFVGGFSATAAQQLAGDAALDPWAVLDALGALIDKSLVAPHPDRVPAPAPGFEEPRFHLLETVRDYARSRLQAGGEAQALMQRHAEQFVALAEAHGGGMLGGEQAAMRRGRLARDLDNLRAAMAWCLSNDLQLGLRLAAALTHLWREHGHLSEGRAPCSALLLRTPDDPPGPTRMAVQVALGAMALEQDDAQQMRVMGEQVLEASRATGNRRREAHGHGLLAHAALSHNELAGAHEHFGACLVIFRETNDARAVAETLNNLAQCRLAEGRPDAALELLREALPIARACGHRWTEAAVLQSLGDVSLALGDEPAAQSHLTESLLLRRAIGHVQQVVMSLQSLALLQIRQRRLDPARAHLLEATGECARHGYGQLDGLCFLAAGAVAALRAQGEAAVRLLAAGHARLDGTHRQPAQRDARARRRLHHVTHLVGRKPLAGGLAARPAPRPRRSAGARARGVKV